MQKNKVSQPEYLELLNKLKLHDHICLIYEDQEEQLSEIIPFVKIGLQRNERCLYVADENTASTVVSEMKKQDEDYFQQAFDRGALQISTKNESYLKDGSFNSDKMIQLLTELTDSSLAQGYTGYRGTAEMTWMLGGDVDPKSVMDYEMDLNTFLPNHEACVICQYNKNKFSEKMLLQVFLTHPKVIYRNRVFENPIYYAKHEVPSVKEQMYRILDEQDTFTL